MASKCSILDLKASLHIVYSNALHRKSAIRRFESPQSQCLSKMKRNIFVRSYLEIKRTLNLSTSLSVHLTIPAHNGTLSLRPFFSLQGPFWVGRFLFSTGYNFNYIHRIAYRPQGAFMQNQLSECILKFYRLFEKSH